MYRRWIRAAWNQKFYSRRPTVVNCAPLGDRRRILGPLRRDATVPVALRSARGAFAPIRIRLGQPLHRRGSRFGEQPHQREPRPPACSWYGFPTDETLRIGPSQDAVARVTSWHDSLNPPTPGTSMERLYRCQMAPSFHGIQSFTRGAARCSLPAIRSKVPFSGGTGFR